MQSINWFLSQIDDVVFIFVLAFQNWNGFDASRIEWPIEYIYSIRMNASSVRSQLNEKFYETGRIIWQNFIVHIIWELKMGMGQSKISKDAAIRNFISIWIVKMRSIVICKVNMYTKSIFSKYQWNLMRPMRIER